MTSHSLYSENADTIESVLAYTRRAQRLTADDGDEFSSCARMRLLDNDCAILRKHRGDSTLRTFLLVVVQNLFWDWRISQWGKWRPSADARRLGPVAIELQRLVERDKVEYEQAVETLLSKGTALSREECDRISAALPRRARRERAGEEALDDVPSPAPDVDPIELDEDRATAARAREALATALPALAPQEQLIIRLRFQDGFTIARIAQLLGEEQKPMYRRIEQILSRLRATMTAAGLTAEALRDLFGNPAVELGAIFSSSGAGKAKVGPSTSSNAGGGA